MKKLLLAIVLLLAFMLVGCNKKCEDGQCNYWPTTELQRYRAKIVEIVNGDDGEVGYIVSKDGYAVGGIYVLETENVYELGDIVYVVVLDEYTAMPFAEWNEDNG